LVLDQFLSELWSNLVITLHSLLCKKAAQK